MMRVRFLVDWVGESMRVVNGHYRTTHREWLAGYTVIDLDVAHVFESYERDWTWSALDGRRYSTTPPRCLTTEPEPS